MAGVGTGEASPLTRLMLIGGLGIFALAFALSAFDLSCAAAVYEPDCVFGQWIARYGGFHAFLLYPLAILLLAWSKKRKRHPLLAQMAAALLTQAVLHTQLLTTLLKWLWGRPRYVQVLAGKAAFTTPFEWQCGSGFVSFPSGHVATALVVLPIAFILWQTKHRRAAKAVFAAVLLYALVVAYGRMQSGAHFLSDVTASYGLALACTPLSVYLGRRYLKLFKD